MVFVKTAVLFSQPQIFIGAVWAFSKNPAFKNLAVD
jgi:hypothetical protein